MKTGYQRVSLLLFLGLIVVGLAGCRNSAYSRSVEKGLNAVAEDKYERALTYFDNALTQKNKDQKAQAYRDQTQAYLDTEANLKAGEVSEAVKTVAAGIKVPNGAASLTNKLTALQKTVRNDFNEYQQLSDEVNGQLKVKKGRYSATVLKKCAAIDWDKKPYLKPLKSKVNKLLKVAKKAKANLKVSAAEAKRAADLRQKLAQAKANKLQADALDNIPDWLILAAFANAQDANEAARSLSDEYGSQSSSNNNSDDYDYSSEDQATDDDSTSNDDSEEADTDASDADVDDDADTDSEEESESDTTTDSGDEATDDELDGFDEDAGEDYEDGESLANPSQDQAVFNQQIIA